jgi:hypothetical protein
VTTFLSILSSVLVGFILILAPWTRLWEINGLLGGHPLLRSIVLSAFTRGAVSGLGIVNILLAFHEAREHLSGSGEGA